MERITVGFYEEVYTKLDTRAKEKKLTLAQYIRQLVDLGLRIEEMSEKKDEQEASKDPLTKTLNLLQKLIEKAFLSNHETLYLTRYLLNNSTEKKSGEHAKMLEAAKYKAQSLLEVMVEEHHK